MYKYFIAFRYLKGRLITWLAIAGVIIGVMALVIVRSVMGGFEKELHDRIRGTMGHMSVESYKFFGVTDPDSLESTIKEVPFVTASSPYIESIALFSGDTLDWGQIKGVDPIKEIYVGNFNRYLLTDEETEAFGKEKYYEELLKRRQEYLGGGVPETEKKKLDGLLASSPLGEKALKEALGEVEKIFKLEEDLMDSMLDSFEKEKLLREEISKWIEKLKIKTDNRTSIELCSYVKARNDIEDLKDKMRGFEKTRESFSDRPAMTEEDVRNIFTLKQKKTHVIEVSGVKVYGKILSQDDKIVKLEIPRGDSSIIREFNREDISDIRDVHPLVVGIQWYKWYNVSVHDSINIITVKPDNLHRTFSMDFEIVGAFKTGMYDTDYRFVYTNLKVMQDFLKLGKAVSGVSVRLDTYDHADTVKQQIESAMLNKGEIGLSVFTWEEKNKTIIKAVNMEKWLLSFILFFMIVIAGFMNLVILSMMVVEKTKDLGIIKAIGGTTGGVFSIFLLTGGFIGIIGTIIGCFLGSMFVFYINEIASFIEMLTGFTPFPKEVYYLDKIPSAFVPIELLFIIFPAVAISFLFSLYPAFRAAQMNPVEAFRYE